MVQTGFCHRVESGAYFKIGKCYCNETKTLEVTGLCLNWHVLECDIKNVWPLKPKIDHFLIVPLYWDTLYCAVQWALKPQSWYPCLSFWPTYLHCSIFQHKMELARLPVVTALNASLKCQFISKLQLCPHKHQGQIRNWISYHHDKRVGMLSPIHILHGFWRDIMAVFQLFTVCTEWNVSGENKIMSNTHVVQEPNPWMSF